jgi:hypothetical protein
MNHLDICNTSYGWKKGWESNWQFDSRPLKVGNRLYPGVCRWSATHRWKAFKDSYKFASDRVPIGGRGEKLWTPKVPGQFWDSTLGVPGKSAIQMQVWRRGIENTIWGKVVASLEFRPWWIKWVRVAHGLSQHQECSEWILTNLLVGFGCRTE